MCCWVTSGGNKPLAMGEGEGKDAAGWVGNTHKQQITVASLTCLIKVCSCIVSVSHSEFAGHCHFFSTVLIVVDTAKNPLLKTLPPPNNRTYPACLLVAIDVNKKLYRVTMGRMHAPGKGICGSSVHDASS